MTDQRSDTKESPSEAAAGNSRNTSAQKQEPSGYVEHVVQVLAEPDRFFDSGHRSARREAMIDLAIFALTYFLAAVVARAFGFSGFGLEFGHFVDGLKSLLVLALPLAGLVFAWSWQGRRASAQTSPAFYLEKLGGALLLPALLLIIAIVLDVIGARFQLWFRGAAMAFVYIGVFAVTYAYAAPGKLRAAVIFTLGFYIAYRLLVLLF